MSVNNDTTDWFEIDVSGLAPTDGTKIPFRLIAARFKSSSPDSEAFIHDPLDVLVKAQEPGGPLEESRARARPRVARDDERRQSPPDPLRDASPLLGDRRGR